MSSPPSPESNQDQEYRAVVARMDRIMDPNHPLCRNDIVWLLNTIKNRLADDRNELPNRDTLLHSYRYYTEVAMLMVHRDSLYGQESERLRKNMKEAAIILWKPQG